MGCCGEHRVIAMAADGRAHVEHGGSGTGELRGAEQMDVAAGWSGCIAKANLADCDFGCAGSHSGSQGELLACCQRPAGSDALTRGRHGEHRGGYGAGGPARRGARRKESYQSNQQKGTAM